MTPLSAAALDGVGTREPAAGVAAPLPGLMSVGPLEGVVAEFDAAGGEADDGGAKLDELART